MKNIIILLLVLASLCVANQARAVGAATPFVSYEAESGLLGGGASIVSLTSPPTTEFSSPQLEASGHAYVQLTGAGQFVQLTNHTGKTITALNVRYSIPDSSSGGGIASTIDLYVSGTYEGQIAVDSYQTWVYETSSDYNGMNQSPSSGNPHVFWDEVSFFVPGGGIPPGGWITLQKDSRNTAAFYDIDVVDFEAPPAALSQPANTLSIASYGAQANNSSFDNSSAIQSCINAAQSAGKPVWIPSGVFYVTNGSVLSANSVTIEGAGPWYSEIYDTSSHWSNGFLFDTTSTSFQNLCIDASQPNATPGLFAILGYGNNWTINNVWARHMMLTWGTGTNILIENSRVNNSWGDGMNINNDNGTSCNDIVVSNNFVRGCGDDSIAVNSSGEPAAPVMNNVIVANNTTVASWWANQMGVYGGYNVLIVSNLFQDSVKKKGVELDSNFGGSGSYAVNQTIAGNTFLRCGSYGYAVDQPGIGIDTGGTNLLIENNTVVNSMFDAIEVQTTWDLVFQGNTINAPGTQGFVVDSSAGGNGVFNYNLLENLKSGQTAFSDSTPYTQFMTGGIKNTGFAQGPYTLPGGWSNADIGSVAVAGGACYNGGTFTVVGSGADIWNTADAFNYTYESTSGNTTITARVNTEEIAISGWSKAGVMIRETTAANSDNAAVLVTPDNGVVLQWRTTAGGSCSNIDVGGKITPLWVRLVRSGNTFTGYYSSNGSSWTTIGSTTISMATSATTGLAITSQSNGNLCSAMLDNVSKTNP